MLLCVCVCVCVWRKNLKIKEFLITEIYIRRRIRVQILEIKNPVIFALGVKKCVSGRLFLKQNGDNVMSKDFFFFSKRGL